MVKNTAVIIRHPWAVQRDQCFHSPFRFSTCVSFVFVHPYRCTTSCIVFSHRKLFSVKKSPPNTFMVLRQLLSNHLVNKCLFHTGQKTHSHVLTPGFRRCCEWVQSPALIGCDGNTTPVWSCKCLPFVKCDSTVHIEVQAAGLSRLFFIHLGATLGHQLDSAEFERDTEVKDKEIRYHCDTVSDFCVTTWLDSCLMGTEHVRLSTEMRKKCDVSLLSLFHHPLWNK